MLTEKDYCDYETCVALKELGYNRGAYAYYFPNHTEDLIFNTHNMRGCSINEMVRGYNTYSKDTVGHELIDAPTMWEAQKWLREEKGVHVEVYIFANRYDVEIFTINEDKYSIPDVFIEKLGFQTYEEALSEGIKEAVKILKEVKKSDNTSVKFTSILRLIEIIPSNVWNQDNRGRVYAEKLANILESEGYSKDAQLVREKIKQMNGENVPLTIMD